MAAPTVTEEPRGLKRLVVAVIQHSETYGPIWFGLIFWGSVLYAGATRLWPDTSAAVLLIASLAVGLASGVGAHRRGAWL